MRRSDVVYEIPAEMFFVGFVIRRKRKRKTGSKRTMCSFYLKQFQQGIMPFYFFKIVGLLNESPVFILLSN